jgi:polysaccharide export outer membrane protein
MSDNSRLELSLGELDIKIQDVEASFKRQIAIELRDVRERLGKLEIALPAALQVRDVKLQHIAGFGFNRAINITRFRDGEAAVFDAAETTVVEPGDVIEVKKLLPGQEPNDDASLGQSRRRADTHGEEGTAESLSRSPPR